MSRLIVIIIGVIAVQVANCAPSNGKENLESSKLESKLDDEPYSIFDNDGFENNKETQRQKRWYDNMPYNYQPPYIRPYDSRSEIENSLSYIQMRLQEILSIAKTPMPPPPPPSIYPIYIPIYIPQVPCGCSSPNNEEPTTKAPAPTTTTKKPQNETVPAIHDRFPEMEDERQNWGIVVNNTLSDYDDDDDGSRPISLTPVLMGNQNGIPAPPVEHGSSQADVNNVETQRITTASPIKFDRPEQSSSQPSICDRAVMSCCLGLDPSFKCIQSRGCRDRALSNNPCNQQYLLSVITRLQNFYG